MPRDHWLEDREKRTIVAYAREHPGQGYRRLTYMMMDADGVAASPPSVHWEIREAMKERDVEIILLRGREAFPDVRPRIISDNGPQFIAREFKAFIRICGMTHGVPNVPPQPAYCEP